MRNKIKIQAGGQLERCLDSNNKKKLEYISFSVEQAGRIDMWINEDSLTYLSIDDAIKLRNALNESLKEAIGL